MIIFAIILVLFITIWLLMPRRMSIDAISDVFHARANSFEAWVNTYPGRDAEVEKFLRIFCEKFGISPHLWNKIKPEDELNVIYDYFYPKATKWWQIEHWGDNLEHIGFIMVLEAETGVRFRDEDEKTVGYFIQLF